MQEQAAQRPNRLRQLREQHELKLYDIAALVRRDPSMVQRYETGESEIPLAIVRQLASHFGVSVEFLMGWDGDQPEEAAA